MSWTVLDTYWTKLGNKKKKIYKSISNSIIDNKYNLGKKNGAIGGKLLGAGGRGFILFYVPQKKHENFVNNFDKKSTF